MDKLKQWVALAALAVLGVVAVSWFVLVSPKKSEASDLEAQAATQVSSNDVLRNDIKTLQAQAKELPRERGKLAAVAAKLPAEPGMPALIRALTQAADASGVKFVSLTPGTPVAATVSKPVVPTANADGEAATPQPVAVATGLTTIPIQISVFGGYYQAQQFVSELEDLPRAFRVTGLTLAPGADPGAITKTSTTAPTDGQHLLTAITGEVYMSSVMPATTTVAGVTGTAR